MKPVLKLVSGDTMYAAVAATSSSDPVRFMGMRSVMYLTMAVRRHKPVSLAGASPA